MGKDWDYLAAIGGAPYAASVIAFLITAALLLVLRPLAKSIGLVDSSRRTQTHSGVIPVIGGISMRAAC